MYQRYFDMSNAASKPFGAVGCGDMNFPSSFFNSVPGGGDGLDGRPGVTCPGLLNHSGGAAAGSGTEKVSGGIFGGGISSLVFPPGFWPKVGPKCVGVGGGADKPLVSNFLFGSYDKAGHTMCPLGNSPR